MSVDKGLNLMSVSDSHAQEFGLEPLVGKNRQAMLEQ